MSEKDHANRIPKRIRELWKANQDVEENMLPSFKTIDTSYSEVAIRDLDGVLLALRVDLPDAYIDILNSSHLILPVRPPKVGKRGEYTTRHYALWADYSHHPYMSSEYIEDGQAGRTWVQNNKPLFEYLGKYTIF